MEGRIGQEHQKTSPGSASVKVLLPAAVVAVSFAAVFARLAGEAPPFAIAFLRLGFASAILTPVYILSRREPGPAFSLPGGARVMIGAAGLCLALHFATWISSIFYTSVASSALLVSTHPVFVAVIGWLVLREPIGPRGAAGVALGLGGSILLALGDRGLGDTNLMGDSLALIGGFAAALYFLAGRRMRTSGAVIEYVYPVYLVAAVSLGLLCLLTRTPVAGYSRATYGWILAMALVCQVIGHTLLNWSLRFVKAYVVAAAVLAEPVGAAVLAYLVLGEPPPAHFYLGAPFILLGVFVVTSAESGTKDA